MAAMKKPSKEAQRKWIERLFATREANTGGIVRRGVGEVKYRASFKRLKDAVEARKFHLVQIGESYVVICRSGANIKIIC
jgi:hypothetical protein